MLLRRMDTEAPPGYVAFVARHLGPLRRDAAQVVGEDGHPDELYPEVLTDVAARWGLLELTRIFLRRPGASETYLRHAFARRSAKWRSGQDRWQVEERIVEERMMVEVFGPDRDWRPPPPPVSYSSAAVRLAPFIRRTTAFEPGPLAEAAVAWWHAYEAHRRRWVIAAIVVAFLFAAMIARAATGTSSSV
jgi:hypothetical protein